MKDKITKEYLKRLRKQFTYNSDSTPNVYSYGVFKQGFASSEIDDYLIVFLNKENNEYKKVRNKVHKEMYGDTCPIVYYNGEEVCLYYRHDVERHVHKVLLKTPTYFD